MHYHLQVFIMSYAHFQLLIYGYNLVSNSNAPPAGHSHQLFHVCAILGTHFQMKAIEQDMRLRRSWLLEHSRALSLSNTVWPGLFCVVVNLLIIALFSLPLLSGATGHKMPRKSPKKPSTEFRPPAKTLTS